MEHMCIHVFLPQHPILLPGRIICCLGSFPISGTFDVHLHQPCHGGEKRPCVSGSGDLQGTGSGDPLVLLPTNIGSGAGPQIPAFAISVSGETTGEHSIQ